MEEEITPIEIPNVTIVGIHATTGSLSNTDISIRVTLEDDEERRYCFICTKTNADHGNEDVCEPCVEELFQCFLIGKVLDFSLHDDAIIFNVDNTKYYMPCNFVKLI